MKLMPPEIQKMSIGQHLSRAVLFLCAVIFAITALVPNEATLSVRMFALAMAFALAHIASNRVALREPALGFRWDSMSSLSRALVVISVSLMALSIGFD